MPKTKRMTGKEMKKFLEENGFELDRITSSHFIMKKGDYTTSVPIHKNETLKIGTLNKILKDAGLK